MNKMLVVVFAFVALLSCNAAKHLEQQREAIENIVKKANADKITVIKDSTVFREGQTKVVSDTAVIWNNVGDTIIKEFHYRNDYYRADTIKIFEANPQLVASERALFSENEKNKAMIEPLKQQVANLKSETRKLHFYLIAAAVFFGLFVGLIIKSKLF